MTTYEDERQEIKRLLRDMSDEEGNASMTFLPGLGRYTPSEDVHEVPYQQLGSDILETLEEGLTDDKKAPEATVPPSPASLDETFEKAWQEAEKATDEDEAKEWVNHPSHYNQGMLETLEKFFLFFHANPDMIKGALLFNVLRYTDRAEHKWDKTEDEKKTGFYLNLFTELFPEDAHLYTIYRIMKNNE